ncbi:hypothetical protein AAMO2058_001719900 [Amorphochlora amoebiformis]
MGYAWDVGGASRKEREMGNCYPRKYLAQRRGAAEAREAHNLEVIPGTSPDISGLLSCVKRSTMALLSDGKKGLLTSFRASKLGSGAGWHEQSLLFAQQAE